MNMIVPAAACNMSPKALPNMQPALRYTESLRAQMMNSKRHMAKCAKHMDMFTVVSLRDDMPFCTRRTFLALMRRRIEMNSRLNKATHWVDMINDVKI